MKKLLALFLAFAMVFSSVAALAEIDLDIAIDSRTVTDAVYANISWYNDTDVEFELSTAEDFAGFAELVDNGNTFEGKTVKLANDIAFTGYTNYNPVGDNRTNAYFAGTFDGQNHTIKDACISSDANYSGAVYGSKEGWGIFSITDGATIKNLVVDGANFGSYTVITGGVVGYSYDTTYYNVTVTDTVLHAYNWYVGGIAGWIGGNTIFEKVTVTDSTEVGTLWGSYDTPVGGVAGGASSSGFYTFKDCNISCKLDVVSDATANYQWFAYRYAGMLIGNGLPTVEVDGTEYPNPVELVKLENVNVTIGDWGNFHYCESESYGKPSYASEGQWKFRRVELGDWGHGDWGNGGIDITQCNHDTDETHNMIVAFNQLFGGGQGVYGADKKVIEEIIEQEYSTNEAYANYTSTLTLTDKALEARTVAKIEDTPYETLQSALDAASVGETVKAVKDVNEVITFKSPDASTPAFADTSTVPSGTTLDLGDFTLTGRVVVETGATANLTNGKIVNEDATKSAIETVGTTTIEDIEITSARHAVRVEGGLTTINSGNFSVVPVTVDMTQHAVNVSDGGKVIINGGTFTGPAGTAANSGSAVCVQAGSTVEIYGGTFTGGFNDTLLAKDGAVLKVMGGTFDQDPTDYVATGYDAIVDTYGMYKVVAAADTDEAVSVVFEEVETVEGEALYNINVVADTADPNALINRLNSADLTFAFNPTAVTGGAMDYEIVEVPNISVTTNSAYADRYMFSFDLKSDEITGTGNVITIGQLKVTGYGSYTVAIVGNNNEVHATTINDNVVDTFIPNGSASGKGDLNVNATITDSIAIPTRELTIQIAFPNTISGNIAAYQDMHVTIDGADYNKTYDLGDIDANGGYVVKDTTLVLNNTYNITVTGAGYRTARYTVTMTEDKTLNFWNNVKDSDTIVEVGKESSAVKVTFLAGDIVKDNNINIYDLSAVVSYFGTTGLSATSNPEYAKYDLNRDNKIDSKDVAYVLASWGK